MERETPCEKNNSNKKGIKKMRKKRKKRRVIPIKKK